MSVEQFVGERRGTWAELEGLVRDAGRKPERLGATRVLRLGALYRQSAADLAAARRRYPGEPFVGRLEELVASARHLVYASERRRGSLWHFATTGYWRRVRERPGLLVAGWLLLLGPMLLSGWWAVRDPIAASGLVPAEYRAVTEQRAEPGEPLGLSADEQAQFSSEIFTNNIRVAVLAFAGGVAFGLPTTLVLVQNAVLVGTIAGMAIWAGNGTVFFELVTAHGVLELSLIVVAAVAGFRLGWALVDPGHRSRLDALVAEARPAAELVLGTAVWLVVAGLVEGFVTPAGYGLGPVLVVGIGLGVVYWGLVLWRGRSGLTEPQSRARALARR